MAQSKQLSKQNRQSAQNVESDQSGNKNTAKVDVKSEPSGKKAGAGGKAKQKAKRG